MTSINKVILQGYVGQSIVFRYLEGNIARLNFTLATSEIFENKTGDRKEHVEWHNIIIWRNLAQKAEKVISKGSYIHLEGKLQTRKWVDKSGFQKNITEIVVENFTVLGESESKPKSHSIMDEANKNNTKLDEKGLPC